MKIVVDVGVGKAVERWLASQSLDVAAVRDLDPGMADIAILALAAAEQRLVITMDKDFGELIVRSGQLHAGVLLLRLADATARRSSESSSKSSRCTATCCRGTTASTTRTSCASDSFHSDRTRLERQLPTLARRVWGLSPLPALSKTPGPVALGRGFCYTARYARKDHCASISARICASVGAAQASTLVPSDRCL